MNTETVAPAAAVTPSGGPRRPVLASRLLAAVLSLPVRAWQLVSRWLPPRCRFYPSCSAYALEALERHGAFRGSWLAARRLSRCHPWNPGGIDHVPQPNVRSADRARSPRPVTPVKASS